MRLSRLFPRWSGHSKARRSVHPRRARLGVHAFEPRITPDVTLSHGHLVVNGDPGVENDMLVGVNGIGGIFIEWAGGGTDGGDFSYNPGDVTDIQVNTNGPSLVIIADTLANVPVTLNCTDHVSWSTDEVLIATNDFGAVTGDLSHDAGPITMTGNGSATVWLADDQYAPATTYTVTFQSVSRAGFGGFSYSNIASLWLSGSSGDDVFNVRSTLAGTTDAFFGGSGFNTFNLGAGTLDALAGEETVREQSGSGQLNLADQASPGNHTYTLDSNQSSHVTSGFNEISRTNVSVYVDPNVSIALHAGDANDTFNVLNPGAQRLLDFGATFDFDGGSGSNTLNLDDQISLEGAPFAVSPSAITVGGAYSIDYNEIETLNLNCGPDCTGVSISGMQSSSTLAVNLAAVQNVQTDISVQSIPNGSQVNIHVGDGVNNIAVGGGTQGVQDIQGLVTLFGTDAGFTTLTLDDTAGTSGRTFLIENDRVVWGFDQVDYLDIQGMVLDGSSGGNTFAVLSTPVGLLTTINAGLKNDVVHAGGTLVGDVSSIQGPLVVNGFINGNTTFTVFDQSNSASQTYTVTSTPTALDITRSGGFSVEGTHLRNVIVHGGSGDDDYVINGVNLTPVTLMGGNGTNALAGPAFGIHVVPWNITGAGSGKIGKNLTFSGMHDLLGSTSTDNFLVGPAGSIAGIIDGGGSDNELSYALQPGPVIVNVGNQTAPQLHGGIAGAWRNIQVFIGSKSAADTLIGPDLDTTWFIGHTNGGFAQGTAFRFSFTGFENLAGGSGLDVFRFISLGQVTGSIDGGAAPIHQGNWLDYSGLGSAVQVNLATGSATGVGGKVLNVQNVHGSNAGSTLTGSAQGNILLGGSGSDSITGGSGASLLIGDAGADTVTGGSGGDILIGDTTAFDLMTLGDLRALMGILAEWQSADSYATRFSDINTGTGGGLNGAFRLNFGTSVKDDGAADVLTAAPTSAGLDWFFQGAGDTLHNIESGEHINNNTPAALADRTVTVTGHRATVSGIITDPDLKNIFTLVFDWGDGSPADTYVFPAGLNGRKIAVSHRYRLPGSYTIHLFWTDPTGPGNSADLVATVDS